MSPHNRLSKLRERSSLRIRARPGGRHDGLAISPSCAYRCALGPAGISACKREGDGATPAGTWLPLRVLYRADRVARPVTALPVSPISQDAGWCDAPGDRNYNRQVKLPYPASCETLWREDHVYDLVVVLDHNTRPRVRGRGSAVFIHLKRGTYEPTEGCVAFSEHDLRRLLSDMTPRTRIMIVV